jgi:hypothetical protein
MCGLDVAGSSGAIVQGFAQLTHDIFQNRIADEGLWPHRIQDLLFRHKLTAAFDQKFEHAKGFGTQRDRARLSPKALVDEI